LSGETCPGIESWGRKSVLRAMAVREPLMRKEKEAVEKMPKEDSSLTLPFSTKLMNGAL
jgi:hypothetical protein